jgi:hypothetical protein
VKIAMNLECGIWRTLRRPDFETLRTLMNFHQISALAAACSTWASRCFVLRRDLRSNINKVYLGWAAAVTLLECRSILSLQPRPDERSQAFFWAHVLQAGVIFMPVTLFPSLHAGRSVRAHKALNALYVVHAVFLLSLFSGFFIRDVKHIGVGGGRCLRQAFGHSWLFTLSRQLRSWPSLPQTETLGPLYRTRVRALLVAIFALWVFGTNDLLPILMPTIAETHLYPFTKIPFIALGNLAAIFYALIVGYSVLQHQLLDIHLQLSRAAAVLVRVCAVGIVCAALLYGASQLVEINAETFFTAIGVMIATFASRRFCFRA